MRTDISVTVIFCFKCRVTALRYLSCLHQTLVVASHKRIDSVSIRLNIIHLFNKSPTSVAAIICPVVPRISRDCENLKLKKSQLFIVRKHIALIVGFDLWRQRTSKSIEMFSAVFIFFLDIFYIYNIEKMYPEAFRLYVFTFCRYRESKLTIKDHRVLVVLQTLKICLFNAQTETTMYVDIRKSELKTRKTCLAFASRTEGNFSAMRFLTINVILAYSIVYYRDFSWYSRSHCSSWH